MVKTSRAALAGSVVTMDPLATVLPRGVVYVQDTRIAAVQPREAAPPDGFADTPVAETNGTLYPGLVELHNHLPYDVLPLWMVPKKYTNRDQWGDPRRTPDYKRLISGPMGVLGRNPDVVPAIVRYVEVRALLGGTTTSQGVALASNSGIVKFYRGLVRNVESTGDPQLRPATTRIADVDATDAERFLARLSGTQKLILHLAEGVDQAARNHFLALRIDPARWAITSNLIGIHCAGLQPADFAILAGHGGSMVWSPLSNLLLYGQTANLGAALAVGVSVALGSDWAPSGSKNLLGELKIARLAAPMAGADVSDRDLLAMATTTPARLLGWDQQIGSLEAGKRADLIVVAGKRGDPYARLLNADESDLDLVMIDGTPRSGSTRLMRQLSDLDGELLTVGHHRKVLQLAQADANSDVAAITVAGAIDCLRAALADLPNSTAAARTAFAPAPAERDDPRPLLAVAGVIENGLTPRPHLPYRGRLTGPNLPTLWAGRTTAAAPVALPALTLDPITAVDNPGYLKALAQEPNLPRQIVDALTPQP